jgi:Iodothyronine deiodinase
MSFESVPSPSMRWLLVCALFLAVSCSAPAPSPAATAREVVPRPAHKPVFDKPVSMAEAKAVFDAAGAQPGQPLPKLALLSLHGTPVDLDAMRAGRAMALVTCSLTCNVARRQQREVAALQQRLGERAFVVMVYTIDAHPKSDACPYTGVEWVPQQNEADDVLVRQPTTLEERLALARRYAETLAKGTTVLVDTMDDAAWIALGRAPNVGLAVGADGVTLCRAGWFDAKAIEAALAK